MNHFSRLAAFLFLATWMAGCAASAPPAASSAAKASMAHYHLLRKLPVGGEGGWDYLTIDAASRRLYVSRGTRVVVIEVDVEKIVGEVPGTQGVHGVAIAPESHRGFTSNGRSSTVTIFDTATLTGVAEVKTTGEKPDAILYDPASRRVFTFNGRGKNATAFDVSSSAVAGTIPLDGKPESGATDGKGRV